MISIINNIHQKYINELNRIIFKYLGVDEDKKVKILIENNESVYCVVYSSLDNRLYIIYTFKETCIKYRYCNSGRINLESLDGILESHSDLFYDMAYELTNNEDFKKVIMLL